MTCTRLTSAIISTIPNPESCFPPPPLVPSPAANTLHTLHTSPTLEVIHKPPGIPFTGLKPVTAIPATAHLPVQTHPPRPISSPVILSLTPQQPVHHILALTHHTPPPNSLPDTLSTTLLRTFHTSTTTLSLLHILSPHPATTLRNRLHTLNCPAVGTVARSKPLPGFRLHGLYICIPRLHLPSPHNIHLTPGIPPKFLTLFHRIDSLAASRSLRRLKHPRKRLHHEQAQSLFCDRWYFTRNAMQPRESTELIATIGAQCLREAFYARVKAGEDGVEARVLDLGTGCGNLIIAVMEGGGVGGWGLGVDVCGEAVEVARRNVAEGVGGGAVVHVEQMRFEEVARRLGGGVVDVVVSNPPYLTAVEVERGGDLFQGDPIGALVGGEDGMEGYRGVAACAGDVVVGGGWVVVEVGALRRVVEVVEVFEAVGLQFVKVVKDFQGFDRCLVMRKPGVVGEDARGLEGDTARGSASSSFACLVGVP